MPPIKQEILISTELNNPKEALEKGRQIAGIRANIEFTLQQIDEKQWKVIVESDSDINVSRLIGNTRGIDLINTIE